MIATLKSLHAALFKSEKRTEKEEPAKKDEVKEAPPVLAQKHHLDERHG